MQPGVIALPLSARTEMEITLVANLISLTPGTLSLDVSDDRKVLYIHAMFLDDEEELRRNLKEMEHRALELFR
jgi:multicomponent Na+:H+ antiporter subunit E